jgi:hypothetical protein
LFRDAVIARQQVSPLLSLFVDAAILPGGGILHKLIDGLGLFDGIQFLFREVFFGQGGIYG